LFRLGYYLRVDVFQQWNKIHSIGVIFGGQLAQTPDTMDTGQLVFPLADGLLKSLPSLFSTLYQLKLGFLPNAHIVIKKKPVQFVKGLFPIIQLHKSFRFLTYLLKIVIGSIDVQLPYPTIIFGIPSIDPISNVQCPVGTTTDSRRQDTAQRIDFLV